MKKKHFIPFLILILFWGCGCKKKIDREVSFYHWKSKFKLGEKEVDYLSSLNVKKLYVRFFDVKWIESEKDAFPFEHLNNRTIEHLKNEVK